MIALLPLPALAVVSLCAGPEAAIHAPGSPPAAAPEAYARPRLLIEPADLQKALSAGEVIVLDARKSDDFAKGRVPSGRWVDAAAWARDFGKGDDPKGWSERIGALGIGPRSRVAVYDDVHFKDAARVWWILRYFGLQDAALLNGGWTGWKAGAFPIEVGPARPPPAGKFEARPQPARLATKPSLLEALKSGRKLQVIDARSEAEYCGTDAQKNRRAGAIPGALNLEWIELIDRPTQRFKPPGELKKVFLDAGIDISKPAVTHCQSGGRSSVMLFGLELLGAEHASNYYASWAEWGNSDDTPVEPGKPKARK